MVTKMLILDRTVFSHAISPETAAGKRRAGAGWGRTGARRGSGQDRHGPGYRRDHRMMQALLQPAGTFGSAFWKECRFEEARGRVTLGLGTRC